MGELVSIGDLSDELLNSLRISLVFPINITVTTIGLLANIANMIVLTTLGIANSMSVGVLALSFTDLLVSLLQLVMYVLYVLDKLYPGHDVDLAALGTFGIGWMRYSCFFISSWITTLISIEKCVCVVWPFQVKRVFTKLRSFFAIVFIYAVHVALIVPIYCVQELRWTIIRQQNLSNETAGRRYVFTFVYTEEFVNVETVVNNIYAVGLAVTSQVILLVCTLWMIYSLKSSSRIRQNTFNETFVAKGNIENVQPSKASTLSLRERKLVKVALSLGVVLTASNIPRYAVVATYYAIPGMSKGEYKNLSDFLWDITDFFSIINCSSTFLVYWMLNSNFRKSFNELFCVYV